MKIVTNASPLHYLILLGHADVLPALYSEVWIPSAVVNELSDPRAPDVVRKWIGTPPAWLKIDHASFPLPGDVPPQLNAGEIAAIGLALRRGISVVLLDERDARREATRRDLAVAGTLRVLADAAVAGLLSLPSVFARLRSTNFRARPALYDELLEELQKHQP